MLRTCRRPNCSLTPNREADYCGRHLFALDRDLRQRLKSAKTPSARGALLLECDDYLESRMIGDHQITFCSGRDCDASIVWLVTKKGTNIAVEASGVECGDDQFQYGKHVAHFTNCPNANDFRSAKR